MLSRQGFNLWADHYDETVQASEESNLYPFAGYRQILNTIFNEVMQKESSTVLDIGFGTAVLTSKLYEHGHDITGIDFSSKMIDLAKLKMPDANLIEWDISNGLPSKVEEAKYDAIISTYTLHHLTDEEKIIFIKGLLSKLNDDGKIYIGDIAFLDREKHESCRQDSIQYWDPDEYYFVYEELKPALETIGQCEYYPISHCGGVFVIFK